MNELLPWILLCFWLFGFWFLWRVPVPEGRPRSGSRDRSLSVIIPPRNEEENLDRLLGSLGRQSPPPLEVIVVDDRSGDGTAEKAWERSGRFYETWLRVRSWKAHVPDVAGLSKGKGFPKRHLERRDPSYMGAFLLEWSSLSTRLSAPWTTSAFSAACTVCEGNGSSAGFGKPLRSLRWAGGPAGPYPPSRTG